MISILAEVPPNWIKVRFDEIAENITDRIEKPNESGLEYYIGLKHLDTDQIRIKRFGSTEDVEATKFLCKKGDIIFGKRNAYLRKVAVTDRDAVVSAHSMVIRPKGDFIVPEFLPCFMQSSIFWKTAHAISEGSMSPTIKWKTMAKQEFWIPTIEEQKKISELLWKIEDATEKSEKLSEVAKKLKKDLFYELITKGFRNTAFEDNNIEKISTIWPVVKLGDHSKINYGYTESATLNKVGPKFLRITDIQDGTVNWDHVPYCSCRTNDYEKYKLENGDIVFARTGATTGKSYLIKSPPDAVFASYLIKVHVNENFIPDFVYFFFQSSIYWNQINSNISGSAQSGINATKLSNLKIVMPTLNDQEKIVGMISILNDSIEKYISNKKYLLRIKKKLTNDYLSGKLLIPKEVL